MTYVSGVRTYTAGINIEPNRIVKIVNQSNVTPIEVTYATVGDVHIVGISTTMAIAGELISIRPMNMNGSVVLETDGSVIEVGTPLYVGANGTVSIVENGPVIGQSTQVSNDVNTIELVSLIPYSGVITDADEVLITDANDYYDSGNVEGALDELGDTFTSVVKEVNYPVQTLTLLDDNMGVPLPIAQGSGNITSDSPYMIALPYDEGIRDVLVNVQRAYLGGHIALGEYMAKGPDPSGEFFYGRLKTSIGYSMSAPDAEYAFGMTYIFVYRDGSHSSPSTRPISLINTAGTLVYDSNYYIYLQHGADSPIGFIFQIRLQKLSADAGTFKLNHLALRFNTQNILNPYV